MSLGCECTDAPQIAQAIAETGKPVSLVSIQAEGGTRAAIEAGVARGQAMMAEPFERWEIGLSDLIVGVECGGSDTTSGIAANPALGLASDKIVAAGGTVIFEETNELLGCEEALIGQAASADVAAEIGAAIARARAWGVRTNQRAISAGNIEGGLTTIEEKSLGAVCKAGSTPVRGVSAGWQMGTTSAAWTPSPRSLLRGAGWLDRRRHDQRSKWRDRAGGVWGAGRSCSPPVAVR